MRVHGWRPASLQVIEHIHTQLHAFHVNICSLPPASGRGSPWLTLSWTAAASLHQIPYGADRFMALIEQRYGVEGGRHA